MIDWPKNTWIKFDIDDFDTHPPIKEDYFGGATDSIKVLMFDGRDIQHGYLNRSWFNEDEDITYQWKLSGSDFYDVEYPITHWMFLPEPPKD